METILKIAAPVFAGLVVLTNIITESVKKVKTDINAKKIALCTALILSVLVCVTAAIYMHFTVWYAYAGSVIVGVISGFMVAQVAETGYDGAYMDLIEIIKTIITAILGTKYIAAETDPEDYDTN